MHDYALEEKRDLFSQIGKEVDFSNETLFLTQRVAENVG